MDMRRVRARALCISASLAVPAVRLGHFLMLAGRCIGTVSLATLLLSVSGQGGLHTWFDAMILTCRTERTSMDATISGFSSYFPSSLMFCSNAVRGIAINGLSSI